MMERLSQLDVFHDDTLRTGPQNMAVDQLLLQNCAEQVLIRFYGWSRPEVSFGYFDTLESAQAKFDDEALHFVRRWTGGGVVDHRKDFTYTIVIPKGHAWASLRGAESYRMIHAAVVEMLKSCGVDAELIAEDSQNTSVACFDRPVTHVCAGKSARQIKSCFDRWRVAVLALVVTCVCGIGSFVSGSINGRRLFAVIVNEHHIGDFSQGKQSKNRKS